MRSVELRPPDRRRPRVALIVGRFPCLSETFVRREIEGLNALGYSLAIVSCAPLSRSDAWLEDVSGVPVFRPPEFSASSARLRLFHVLSVSRDFRLDRRLLKALVNAAPGVRLGLRSVYVALALQRYVAAWHPDRLHGHFLNLPALVTHILANRLSVPYSLSAHARDVFVPQLRMDAICEAADFVTVCSRHAQASLLGKLRPNSTADVVYGPHGVPMVPNAGMRPHRDAKAPFRILSIGRMVEKKGVETIIRAMAQLEANGIDASLELVGDGPEMDGIRALTCTLGLQRVCFVGQASPGRVSDALDRAHALVVASQVASDGDRDGIPNVILEAMAAGVPVVATDCGGISEVVRDRITGRLVPPRDPSALAAALSELIDNESVRRSFAASAQFEILQRFSLDANIALLGRRLEGAETN